MFDSRTDSEAPAKGIHHEKGVTYFSKRTERTIFFILTIVMLCWGLVEGVALGPGN